jgi:hypothetical protein
MTFNFEFKEKFTENQKKRVNKHKFLKSPKVEVSKYGHHTKLKYWCEVKKDWYFASDRHTHCKLCWRQGIDDQHEVILFDPKIHKEEE